MLAPTSPRRLSRQPPPATYGSETGSARAQADRALPDQLPQPAAVPHVAPIALATAHPSYQLSSSSLLSVPSPTTSTAAVLSPDAVAPVYPAVPVPAPTSPALSVPPSRPVSPAPRDVHRVPSLNRIDPFARVFPLPPADGAPAPTIRPGSVRSISFESRPKGESPDDDRGSRASRRSGHRSHHQHAAASARPSNAPASRYPLPIPPPPPMPPTIDPPLAAASLSDVPVLPVLSATPATPATTAAAPPVPPPAGPGGLKPATRAAKARSKEDIRDASAGGEGPSRPAAAGTSGASGLPKSASAAESIGVIGTYGSGVNQSALSLSAAQAKAKDEKKDNVDPRPRLTSLYLVSGLGKDPSQWALSDKDSTSGVQPLEDSLGVFWRPDMLGSTFSGERSEDWGKKGSQRSMNNSTRRQVTSRSVPGTGPDGPSRLVARAMKYAHPKDVEVVNSTLAPPTTCHTFTFSVSRHNTLDAVAAQRKSAYDTSSYNMLNPSGNVPASNQERLRGTAGASDLVFYGVTLTVWSHVDKDRSTKLKEFKQRRMRSDSGMSDAAARERARARRGKTPWLAMSLSSRNPASDYTTSETGMSDSDLETTFTTTDVDYSLGDLGPAYGENCDIFWLPYALTLVSRYPIYDVMQDYLRLSWARYSKDARAHMRQIFSLLNTEAPRPGDNLRLPIGLSVDDEVIIEAVMPGDLDFDKGTIKVDFQLWPLFQALDIDHIMTCVEVALSNSGRIIFCSRHPAMLGAAVETLKYIVELRGWNGIALPNIHARDTTFLIEDPGPYIIGVAAECRYIITPPPEVVIVDLDMNSLHCKSLPPNVVTPRHKREKARHKLYDALGADYPTEHSVPTEYRVSFPKGSFRNIHRIYHGPARPRYLSERLSTPRWWNQNAVITVFDKIMADRHKKPSLFQRLTKSGFARQQEQLTANERLAKLMMRKRALHYVEKRDDTELKVARITRRLQKLVQEGEQWKHRFETFEKYAERLSREAEDLKAKIDREQREARRLSNINSEHEKVNSELQEKLMQTEGARAEAMRQLSDMHHSIQELERERNEIMDIIEMQITTALQHLPYVDLEEGASAAGESGGATSQPTSPRTVTSVPGSGSIRRIKRPATRDSTQSTYTLDSGKMSVLGQLNEGSVKRGLGSILDLDQVSNADRILTLSKNDSISTRVAVIQAKLELALAPVHHLADSMSEEAAAGDTSTEAQPDGDDDGSPVKEPTPPEGASAAAARTARTDNDGDADLSNCTTPVAADIPETPTPARTGGGAFTQSPEETHVELPDGDDLSAGAADGPSAVHDTLRRSILRPRPNTFRPVVLRPPPRRVTQKKSYDSVDATLQATKDKAERDARRSSLRASREIILTPIDVDGLRHGHSYASRHSRELAHAHGGYEPSPSSYRGLPEEEGRTGTKRLSLLSLDERPASVISTTTVTFGP